LEPLEGLVQKTVSVGFVFEGVEGVTQPLHGGEVIALVTIHDG
jgi:hypothetical protein